MGCCCDWLHAQGALVLRPTQPQPPGPCIQSPVPLPCPPGRYNKEALRLRIFYLLNQASAVAHGRRPGQLAALPCPAPRAIRLASWALTRHLAWPGLNPVQPAGAESYTALCTDIPGVAYGTIPNRADGTLLKLIPKSAQLRSCLRCRLGRAACWAAAPCRRHAAVAEAFAFRLAPNRSVPLPLPLATRRHQGEGFRADGHAGKGCRRSGHRRRWCSHQDGVHQGRRGGRYAARCGGGWPRAVQASPSLHSLLGACMLTLALSVKAD